MSCQLYRHYDKEGRLLYVGISLSAIARAAQHKGQSGWFKDCRTMTVHNFKTREDARDAEVSAIKREHPIHNACSVALSHCGGEPGRLRLDSADIEAAHMSAVNAAKARAQALDEQCAAIERQRDETERFCRERLRRMDDVIADLNEQIVTKEHILWQMYARRDDLPSGRKQQNRSFTDRFLDWVASTFGAEHPMSEPGTDGPSGGETRAKPPHRCHKP